MLRLCHKTSILLRFRRNAGIAALHDAYGQRTNAVLLPCMFSLLSGLSSTWYAGAFIQTEAVYEPLAPSVTTQYENISAYMELDGLPSSQPLCLRLPWPWPLTFWPRNLIITNPIKSAAKMGEIPFICFWDMVFTRFSGRTADSLTHSFTHRQRDPITECVRHRFLTAAET